MGQQCAIISRGEALIIKRWRDTKLGKGKEEYAGYC